MIISAIKLLGLNLSKYSVLDNNTLLMLLLSTIVFTSMCNDGKMFSLAHCVKNLFISLCYCCLAHHRRPSANSSVNKNIFYIIIIYGCNHCAYVMAFTKKMLLDKTVVHNLIEVEQFMKEMMIEQTSMYMGLILLVLLDYYSIPYQLDFIYIGLYLAYACYVVTEGVYPYCIQFMIMPVCILTMKYFYRKMHSVYLEKCAPMLKDTSLIRMNDTIKLSMEMMISQKKYNMDTDKHVIETEYNELDFIQSFWQDLKRNYKLLLHYSTTMDQSNKVFKNCLCHYVTDKYLTMILVMSITSYIPIKYSYIFT